MEERGGRGGDRRTEGERDGGSKEKGERVGRRGGSEGERSGEGV